MAETAILLAGPFGRGILRCREAQIDEVSARLGTALPRATCRSASGGGLVALWLGPDEWLVLTETGDDGWATGNAARLDGVLCSWVDIGHRQLALTVRGPSAERILATGCPLDLAEAAFPVGMCTRTIFAKAEIVLWRTGPTDFHLEIWRSLAPYVEALLREAESEP